MEGKVPIQVCYKAVGLKIRRVREALGMTQEELAKRVGLVRTSIANIEAGRQRLLLHEIEGFAAGLGTTPKHLLRGIWT